MFRRHRHLRQEKIVLRIGKQVDRIPGRDPSLGGARTTSALCFDEYDVRAARMWMFVMSNACSKFGPPDPASIRIASSAHIRLFGSSPRPTPSVLGDTSGLIHGTNNQSGSDGSLVDRHHPNYCRTTRKCHCRPPQVKTFSASKMPRRGRKNGPGRRSDP